MREPLPAAGIKAKSLVIQWTGLTMSGDCISTASGVFARKRKPVTLEIPHGDPHLAAVLQGL
jgi:hypothetical protein